MHVELKYFSGTGNSFKILDTCRESFSQNGCDTKLSSIVDDPVINEESELIGFCFPVYAFGIPRICRKYLQNMPAFVNPINAFVIITAGEEDESGLSVQESMNIAQKKGLRVVYSAVIRMPANWTVSMNPPSKDEAQSIIASGVNKARGITKDILDGVNSHHRFSYPARYSKIGFYKDYYLFKWFGLDNLWRYFRTDETCNSCGLCSEICPTRSIQIVDSRPQWLKTCEQCMRCVNYCPKQAIYQQGEGSIKGKNVYYEPSFRPVGGKDHDKVLS